MTRLLLPLFALVLAFSVDSALSDGRPGRTQAVDDPLSPPYHPQPPNGPLPPTLDAGQFASDHAAFVSYALAARSESVLYQVPCYCPCKRRQGHESLLDCFLGKHGAKCPICQKEAVFCFKQSRKGKTPAEIRKGIKDGKAWKINLDREAAKLYPRLSGPSQ